MRKPAWPTTRPLPTSARHGCGWRSIRSAPCSRPRPRPPPARRARRRLTSAPPPPPGTWRAFYGWQLKALRYAEDLSDMAVECEGFRVRVGRGIEGVEGEQRPHVKVEETAVVQRIRSREAEEARREAEEQTSSPDNRSRRPLPPPPAPL